METIDYLQDSVLGIIVADRSRFILALVSYLSAVLKGEELSLVLTFINILSYPYLNIELVDLAYAQKNHLIVNEK